MEYLDVLNMSPEELAEYYDPSEYNPADYTVLVELTPTVVPQWLFEKVVEYIKETVHMLGHSETMIDVARPFISDDEQTIRVWTKVGGREELLADIQRFIDN